MKFYAVINLLGDCEPRGGVGGREGLVEAEGATARANSAVAIWAGETATHRNFLHARAKLLTGVAGVGVEATSIAPREYLPCAIH